MTAAMPDLRTCRLYRFYVEHPLTGEEVLGYVGETIREPFERLMEHVQSQPWIDTVTRWEKDPRVFGSKVEVLAAEAAAIRDERPLYNVRGNEQNPDRIIPPDAIRQRRARDAQQGADRWVHPADRSTTFMPERPVKVARKWTPPQVKLCLWSSSWGLTVLATLAALHHYDAPGSWQARLIFACLAAAILLGWSLAGAPVRKRPKRRRLRARIKTHGLSGWTRW